MKKPETVAFAKDVLAQLNIMQIIGGSYIDAPDEWIDHGPNLVNIPLEDATTGCRVCALGAMYLVKCRLAGTQTVSVETDSAEMEEYLSDLFTASELDEIEAAFEVWVKGHAVSKSRWPTSAFGQQFATPKKRLAAVMQYLIDHDGEFALPARTEAPPAVKVFAGYIPEMMTADEIDAADRKLRRYNVRGLTRPESASGAVPPIPSSTACPAD